MPEMCGWALGLAIGAWGALMMLLGQKIATWIWLLRHRRDSSRGSPAIGAVMTDGSGQYVCQLEVRLPGPIIASPAEVHRAAERVSAILRRLSIPPDDRPAA